MHGITGETCFRASVLNPTKKKKKKNCMPARRWLPPPGRTAGKAKGSSIPTLDWNKTHPARPAPTPDQEQEATDDGPPCRVPSSSFPTQTPCLAFLARFGYRFGCRFGCRSVRLRTTRNNFKLGGFLLPTPSPLFPPPPPPLPPTHYAHYRKKPMVPSNPPTPATPPPDQSATPPKAREAAASTRPPQGVLGRE